MTMELEAFEETAPEVVEKTPSVVLDPASLSDEQKAELGHSLEKEIVEDSGHVMARYLRIGRNLYAVAANKLWSQMGYDSFDAWRAQPELNMSRATGYALMKVFEVFVERLRVAPEKIRSLDWSKLYALSAFATPENVDELLDKARALSRLDLQREVSMMRALSKGQSQAQAQAQLDVLDIVREACPIGCGAKCGLISQDQDAAVLAFKKFLGNYRALSAKIRSLFGKTLAPAQQSHEPEQVSNPADAVPSHPETPAGGSGDEPHLQERPAGEPVGEPVHGQGADGRGEVLEEAGGADRPERHEAVWPQ